MILAGNLESDESADDFDDGEGSEDDAEVGEGSSLAAKVPDDGGTASGPSLLKKPSGAKRR